MSPWELKLRLYSAMKAEIAVCQADAGRNSDLDRNLGHLAECLESLIELEERHRGQLDAVSQAVDIAPAADPVPEPPQRARLVPYLRTIAALAWSAFRHPTKTTVIDWSTGRVIGHYDSRAAA
jgi:hypothetical protein